MKSAIFIFGRTPTLSLLEVSSLYPQAKLICDGVALVPEIAQVHTVLRALGGTVKIAQHVGNVKTLTAENLLPFLIKEAIGTHITFGVSGYGGIKVPAALAATVKKMLQQRGLSARFIETKHDEALSSVVITKQQVVEVVVLAHDGEITVGVTRAVQDFEDWNKRDFGRPGIDPKTGMLPPKVARMIVNIALGKRQSDAYTPTVFDPYCGVGTVLSEALMLGVNAVGSDISETAVRKAKKNLEWLRREYPEVAPLYSNIFVSDATHVSRVLTPASVDAIVTEPYMGETVEGKNLVHLTPERVKNILKGLEKLYIGSLREWVTIVKPHARIVMAMPSYAIGRGIFGVKKVVDRCESLGYTLLTGPIEYSRPQAVVRRMFYVFQKT